MSRFRTTRTVALALASAAALMIPVGTAHAAPGDPTTVNLTLIGINDFHGRIDANTVKFAGTVEGIRAAGGEANTAFIAAGDNIGASLFASAVAQDQPTIDVLNALHLDVSSVGNHEFDQGFSDLTDRVIAGGTNAKWQYLAANVYDTTTGANVLPSYAILDVAGLKVGVIGAVTQETPTLVSPSGVVNLTFGDPVAAINRVTTQLTDGDPSNGEADVIVATLHEGASEGTPDGATLEQEVAAGGAFANIVNNTSPKVAAIFTGHTHKQYAWDAPIPDEPGKTRPILQTGDYGENVGKIVLTVDTTSHAVTAYTSVNVPRVTTDDAVLATQYPRVAAVKTIVDKAIADSAVVGNVPVGTVSADITTAYIGGSNASGVYVGGSRDDRSKESALSDEIANALNDSLASPEHGGSQIGIVNPGGVRAELLYAPDGTITYAESNAVLPFVNNLWTETLTGAQFKTALEQQWQRDATGAVPSRPYLQLGLSKNVTYTFDPTLPEGSRITSITINGAPIDLAADYRVGSFSFLLEGGDNFRIFASGTDVKDSGLIDRDVWKDYIGAHSPLGPDFARQAVQVTNLPTTAAIGSTVSFGVAGLDLTSLGAPANTTVAVSIGGVPLGTAPVTAGAATINLTVPASVPAGAQTLLVVASPSGTTTTIPVTVSVPSTSTLTASKPSQVFGGSPTTLTATVGTANGSPATGNVVFSSNGTMLATVALSGGKATYKLASTTPVGTYSIVATYAGSPTIIGSTSAAVTVTVVKAKSGMLLFPNQFIQFKGGRPTTLWAAIGTDTGVTAEGTVQFLRNGVIVGTAPLVHGVASFTLPTNTPAGFFVFTATYAGSPTVTASKSNAIPIFVLR